MTAHSDACTILTADQVMQKIAGTGLELAMENHTAALTVDEWTPLHEKFTKVDGSVLTRCLFMKDKKKQLFLLVTLASTKTDLKLFAKAAGAKEPRFAAEDILEEKLGVKKGAVNPFCIVNDVAGDVKLYVEEALMNSDKPLCFHPSDNTKTVFVTAAQLKQYFEKSGKEFTAVDLVADASAPAAKPAAKPAGKQAKPAKAGKVQPKEGVNQDGMTYGKEERFPEWYQEVIVKSELIEYYDIGGCYILRPGAMGIWKNIQDWLDRKITRMGAEPCYFPMFVKKSALEKEEGHLEGFAAEVAWVTKSGTSDLEEPIAIRPTSETVMYPSFAKWIRSHRNLPLRLNQWCNVVRWEFSHATPFIRTREFLWQEGHTAHETKEEAGVEVDEVLGFYAGVYEDLLAVPVVRGTKTEKEKFAGGDYTKTVEAFVPTVGRSVQGATSHCLGTTFGKMFDIQYLDRNKEKQYPIQNSWGLTTRTIGVMIMVHGDDKGLVLPPPVAPTQVVIIGVGINKDKSEAEVQRITDMAKKLDNKLKDVDIRSKADLRDTVTSGNKCNHWELRGVPIRIEVGTKEMDRNVVQAVFRARTGAAAKKDIPLDDFEKHIAEELKAIHKEMFEKARDVRDEKTATLLPEQWDSFAVALNDKKVCLVPFCGGEACEDQIKKDSAENSRQLIQDNTEVDERAPSMGAKSLCIPDEPKPSGGAQLGDKCIHPACKAAPKAYVHLIHTAYFTYLNFYRWTLFGRSY